MCGSVTTFVIGVDGEVQAHEVEEVGVIAHAEHLSEVRAPVESVISCDMLAIEESAAVDIGSEAGEAKRNLASLDSLQGLQAQFDDVRQQISQILQPAAPAAPASPALAPVLNAFGQETGTLVNVTA